MLLEETKVCTECGEEFPATLEFFSKNKLGKHWLQPKCRPCRNSLYRLDGRLGGEKVWEDNIQRKYGITKEDYTGILEKQNSCCAICGTSGTRKLCVDHNHDTGKVRGLLCDMCNSALGFFKDSKLTLSSAVEYLEKYDG